MKEIIQGLTEDTKTHSKRTEELAVRLAKRMCLNGNKIAEIQLAALYHDLGKAQIPLAILNKPGKLTEKEFEIIKQHPAKGSCMLIGEVPYSIREMVLYHHENVDGSGYYRIKGDSIPLGSRIIHICDVYDALISDRPYRKAWSKEEIMNYMEEQSGKMFDSELLSKFLEIVA